MDKYTKTNFDRWNELVKLNFESKFYNVEGFISGRNSLQKVEIEELGNLKGKKVLHLQCHFGMDSFSMVRLGASVVGIDFSPEAIKKANDLRETLRYTENQVRFIECNVLELENLSKEDLEPESFDIVFTSHGVLGWLNDLKPWGKSIYTYLKPFGFFLVVEMHPFAYTYDEKFNDGIRLLYSYFYTGIPDYSDEEGAYSDTQAKLKNTEEYFWAHDMGKIMDSLISAGLKIEHLHEFPFLSWKFLPFLERKEDRYFHYPDSYTGPIAPLMFSLKAKKS